VCLGDGKPFRRRTSTYLFEGASSHKYGQRRFALSSKTLQITLFYTTTLDHHSRSLVSMMFNSHLLSRLRSPRGRFPAFGLSNPLSSLSPFSRGRETDLLGLGSRYSRYGYDYDCELCTEIPSTGEHLCMCRVRAREAQLELEEIAAMDIGCGCPNCPFDRYRFGLYGGGGLSL
jgi:hypothetical protein